MDLPRVLTSDESDRPDSRTALLNSAVHLFTERGFSSVSTRELADTAGVNLGAIQYHFGSKANLFVEAVQALMKERGGFRTDGELADPPADAADAARKLAIFVARFLEYLLRPRDREPCRLLFREVLSGTDADAQMLDVLVRTAVEEYMRPTHERVESFVSVLVPGADPTELALAAQSVIGQCTYYVTHRAFLGRLRGTQYGTDAELARVSRHVASFTLKGLGVPPEIVSGALDSAVGSPHSGKAE